MMTMGYCLLQSYRTCGSVEHLRAAIDYFEEASVLYPDDALGWWAQIGATLLAPEVMSGCAADEEERKTLLERVERAAGHLKALLRSESRDVRAYADAIAESARQVIEAQALSERLLMLVTEIKRLAETVSIDDESHPKEPVASRHVNRRWRKRIVFVGVLLLVTAAIFLSIGLSIGHAEALACPGALCPAYPIHVVPTEGRRFVGDDIVLGGCVRASGVSGLPGVQLSSAFLQGLDDRWFSAIERRTDSGSIVDSLVGYEGHVEPLDATDRIDSSVKHNIGDGGIVKSNVGDDVVVMPKIGDDGVVNPIVVGDVTVRFNVNDDVIVMPKIGDDGVVNPIVVGDVTVRFNVSDDVIVMPKIGDDGVVNPIVVGDVTVRFNASGDVIVMPKIGDDGVANPIAVGDVTVKSMVDDHKAIEPANTGDRAILPPVGDTEIVKATVVDDKTVNPAIDDSEIVKPSVGNDGRTKPSVERAVLE